jgi:2-polyprenyl-6-methoxyphenol hydroxylase-like FAD-dependent oxidoreductase
MHTLIIGGGLGGLCLAQGLTRSGLSVAVYERDASAAFRGQGYRIGIKDAGSDALRDCLPADLYDLCMATSIGSATRMVFMDHQLNVAKTWSIIHGGSGFGANRLTLREIMLTGLGAIVRFGAAFERYTQEPDGRIRAHFADGTSAVGDLLVGADGTRSAVRRQLLPDSGLDELGRFIYGRAPFVADVPGVLIDTFNQMTGPGGVTMSVATCRKRGSAPNLTDIADYFAWTVRAADLTEADPAALHSGARSHLGGWHPAVQRIVDEADVAATFLVTVDSARPVQPWEVPNVTLVGDAIHTMSPGRGEGANTALRDAALLRRTLASGAPKARYEEEMLRYGFKAVADSRDKPLLRRSLQMQNAKPERARQA